MASSPYAWVRFPWWVSAFLIAGEIFERLHIEGLNRLCGRFAWKGVKVVSKPARLQGNVWY